MPVNDIAAQAVGGQSQKHWTQGLVFCFLFFADETCTNSVNTDVPGLNLWSGGW